MPTILAKILRFEMKPPFHIAISDKNNLELGGFSKILRNFQSGSCQMLTSAYKVGGWGKKGQKHAYVIFEWSLKFPSKED